MKKGLLLFALILPLACLLVAGIRRSRMHAQASLPGSVNAAGNAPTGFALVELFTSEGCSSCPPADEALIRIAAAYKENVYVLGYHVDYWDRLGWKDAYSDAAYTQRQQEYARVFRLSSIYTPQAVVNGQQELVGSDEKGLRSDIDEDLKKAGGKKITLRIAGGGTAASGGVTGAATGGTAAASGEKTIKIAWELPDRGVDVFYIALAQAHAETKVGAGENNGRKLQHINIVRDLKTIPATAGSSGSVELTLPQGLQAKDCKVIAFLQTNKAESLVVTGAAELDGL